MLRVDAVPSVSQANQIEALVEPTVAAISDERSFRRVWAVTRLVIVERQDEHALVHDLQGG